MKELLNKLSQKRYQFPHHTFLETVVRSFSPAERVLFGVFFILLIWGAGSMILRINNFFLTEIPAQGGELQEGIIGSPRFINPLLVQSDADRDLAALIYSGLLKATPEGELVPDLAERFTVSEDTLTYTFTLREDARFHDGTPVTADDVLFTIQKAQDSVLKSSKRANWEGVTVTKINDREIKLILNQPYAPFLENATLGILPKHLWKDADAEQFPFSPYNIDAVGSGPYRLSSIKRNNSGIPIYMELKPFRKYALGMPHIARLTFRFYSNEKDLLEALTRGEIESANAITPSSAKELQEKGFNMERTPLPRIFGVFFNQNQAPLLADKNVRQALELATDKNKIVDTVLHGYGITIESPIPPLLLETTSGDVVPREKRLEKANALLDTILWKRDPKTGFRTKTTGKQTQKLTFSLATSNVPELKGSAELLKEMWRDIGVDLTVQIYESGDLNQNIIRTRKYDALLFGEIVGRDLDLFAFWHSSQRNDPGLNISLYTNSKVDRLLEEARRIGDREKRIENYKAVTAEIERDTPAIFLYSPEFIYIFPKKIKGNRLERSTIPSERFLTIHDWYINTEKVWGVFAKDKNVEQI